MDYCCVYFYIQGCKPDCITYAALLGAYEKARQWVRALRVYEGMLSQVDKPRNP